MKAFEFLSAVAEFGTIPNGSDMAAVWGDIAKIKETPVACVQTENQFIFIYEMG